MLLRQFFSLDYGFSSWILLVASVRVLSAVCRMDLSDLQGLSCDSRVGASRGFCSDHSLPRSLVLSVKVVAVRKRPTCADLGTQQCVGTASVRLLSSLVPLRCGRR